MQGWIALCACLLVAPPPSHELTLASGEVLRGQLVEQTADRVVFEHPLLGRLELPGNAVAALTALADAPPAPAPPGPDPGQAAPPPPPPRWTSRIELGFSGSAGTSEDTNLRLAFKTAYKTPQESYTIDASHILTTSRGDRTDNKFTAGILAEWPFAESRWSYFAQGRYNFDEFQSWEHRISAGGGLGYPLVNLDNADGSDRFDFKLRGGLGARKEFGSLREDVQPEGIFAWDLEWNVAPGQAFSTDTAIYPNLQDLDDYRVVTNARYTMEMDALEGLNLTVGIAHEWQSRVDPGVPPNDFTAYVSLGLDF